MVSVPKGAYFDYIPEFDGIGYAFDVSDDSPNEVLAAKLCKKFESGKPFRMVIVDILDL